MKRIALAAAAVLAVTSTAWAGAKDKSSNTLVDINAAGVIDNTTVKTKTKSKDCTLQIQAKPVALADGEVVICIAEADVLGVGGNSLVIAGEAKAGQLKIKAPLGEVSFGGLGCGDVVAISYNGGLRCFKDDLTYRSDAAGPGSWRAACTAAGMIPGPLPTDAPGATKLKVNSTQSIAVGLCQGFTLGSRINPPPTVEWARQGQRTPILP